MRYRLVSWTFFVAMLMFVSVARPASPLKDPKRVINDRTVDLSPLFRWWKKPVGERPLSGWSHITGSVVGTNNWGWILEARTEGADAEKNKSASGKSSRIVLKNPPVQELTKFNELVSRSKALNEKRTSLSAQASQAEGHSQELSGQLKVNRKYHAKSSPALRQESRHWHELEKQAKDQIKLIDKDLKEIDGQLAVFPERDRYQLDCLALPAGHLENGLTLYDHGVPLK